MALFGLKKSLKANETKTIPWGELNSLEQLETIKKESKTIPIAIFKHSTGCGISRMVLRNFESSFDISPDKMNLYYLDLLNYREISNEVGYQFQVIHQSPQLLVIKNGETVYHASHHSIHAGDLINFI